MTKMIGFMQGRLCDQVDNKIQAFPWRDWQKEFRLAENINIRLIEWTLDQERLHENPLMTKNGREQIKKLCSLHNITVSTLTGDCFMQAPFWKTDPSKSEVLKNVFLSVCKAASELSVNLIVVPLVDNGALRTKTQEDTLVDFMLKNEEFFRNLGLKIVFESDYKPDELARFIDRFDNNLFGINYDIGNSASMGFNPIYECNAYGNRILNVHVKDRLLGGDTVPLKKGAADFMLTFSALSSSLYDGHFILQTARAQKGEHVKVLNAYKIMVENWISQFFNHH